MEWTMETYRLDEIEGKFELPCVICVNEGYYSETDTEGFSQGDIMSIDSKMVLHKVAANFAFEEEHSSWQDPTYVKLVEKEILVPLNYKGKLKVLRDVENFDSVIELAKDFPRYAKLRENLRVTTEDQIQVTVQAGTLIELDRIIPETGGFPGKLVIQFPYRGNTLVVAVPLNTRGKFRTEPDNNEYTIKEAIDRYSLPQIVRFVDDEIKRVYTQDLLEGIENMRTITAKTLRLNRLIQQNVLVGHYKPVDEMETNDTERFRQRTLVVLPIDNPDIRDIEVNVLKGITDEIYEQVFLVRNVSNSDAGEIVDGSLYVDFAMATPGIRIISRTEETLGNAVPSEGPPPRPPKPKHLKSQTSGAHQSQTKKMDSVGYVEYKPAKDKKNMSPIGRRRKPPPIKADHDPNDSELGEYIYPETSPSDHLDFSLADVNFSTSEKNPLKTSKGKELLSNFKHKFISKDKVTPNIEALQEQIKKTVTASVKPRPSDPKTSSDDDEDILPVYDEVDEWKMNSCPYKPLPKRKPAMCTVGGNEPCSPLSPTTVQREKPTARVIPSSNLSGDFKKEFKDLNSDELVDRLNVCSLHDFAKFCKKEKLNGAFFTNVSTETLSNDMNLKGIPLHKFIQMRDHNWVPT